MHTMQSLHLPRPEKTGADWKPKLTIALGILRILRLLESNREVYEVRKAK
jgi:hypothetical protein